MRSSCGYYQLISGHGSHVPSCCSDHWSPDTRYLLEELATNLREDFTITRAFFFLKAPLALSTFTFEPLLIRQKYANRMPQHCKWTWNWDTNKKIIRDRRLTNPFVRCELYGDTKSSCGDCGERSANIEILARCCFVCSHSLGEERPSTSSR